MAVRLITMLIFLASLYLATFAKPAMVIFSGISISIAFQFLIVLLGLGLVSLDNKRSSNFWNNYWNNNCNFDRNYWTTNFRQ